MTPPLLLENFDSWKKPGEPKHRKSTIVASSTTTTSGARYDALTDPRCVLRNRLFLHASNPWEGETLELKVALIRREKRTMPSRCGMLGLGPEGWVSTQHYEEAVALCKHAKEEERTHGALARG